MLRSADYLLKDPSFIAENTGSEIQISRRLDSARSICVYYILNASRLVYANSCSHRTIPDEYHIRDVKYT